MIRRLALLLLAALAPALSLAAASVQPLTPQLSSVAAGESQVFSARFFDALGRPAVGERVRWSNDACGTFQNGALSEETLTDATGVASVTFRASFPPGITCWILAAAGVVARFDVLTFRVSEVALQVAFDPAEPWPGEPYTVRVSPRYGAYAIHNVDVAARVIAGSDAAAVAPERANTGQEGIVAFQVTPAGPGSDYQLELTYRTQAKRVPVKVNATPWQDMWWAGPAENGWGVSVVQHQDRLFTVIYAYDAAGLPTWYVMSGGEWDAAGRRYSGPVYVPRGSPHDAYDVARFSVGTPVGQAALVMVDKETIILEYTLDGVAGRKTLMRHQFGPAEAPLEVKYGDMWWGGASQDGWGIALLQQYRTFFGVWFTYDAAGRPTWFVMPSGFWSDARTYEGRLYRATGSPWLGTVYDRDLFRTTDAGTFRFRFASPEAATFEYVIDRRGGTLELTRTPF